MNSLLHDRLYQAQGGKTSDPNSKLPFQTVDIRPHMESGPSHKGGVPSQPQVQPNVGGLHAVPNTVTSAAVTNPYQRTVSGIQWDLSN